MTMIRGQYAQLLAPGIDEIFNQWMETYQRDLEYPHIFHVENSTKAYEMEVEFAGTPPALEKPENSPVSYTQFVQGGSLRAIHLTYALAARVSHELYDDDQYGLTKQIPQALARSMRFVEEMVAWNIFNLGFSTAVTIDGKSLFNNQHPLLGGPGATSIGPGLGNVISLAGTYPNRPAVDVDLSFTAIQLMTNQFERLVDGQGLPIVMKPKAILIAPANRFLARELLGSPGKPGTATNEINSLLGEDLGYLVGHYLTSDTAWFALCDKSVHRLKFFRRQNIMTDYDDDFDTNSLKQKTHTRFSVLPAHWYGTWGSNGP